MVVVVVVRVQVTRNGTGNTKATTLFLFDEDIKVYHNSHVGSHRAGALSSLLVLSPYYYDFVSYVLKPVSLWV